MGIGFDGDRAAYLAEALAPERLTRVVDIGANPLSEPPYAPLLRVGLCEVWGFETERLKHLALLSDAVFDSQDLAVAALEKLVDRDVLTDETVHGYLDRLPFVATRQDA